MKILRNTKEVTQWYGNIDLHKKNMRKQLKLGNILKEGNLLKTSVSWTKISCIKTLDLLAE